jgi:DNA-binding CsgD family transcriptional regulator
MRLLDDVDRVTISMNIACDLENPEEYRPSVAITKHNSRTDVDGGYVSTSHLRQGSHAERLLEDFKRQGYPVDHYYPPHSFDYYYGGQAYLATLFLWREATNTPISRETIDLIGALEPFLVFVLSDLVARRQRTEPDVRMFNSALLDLFQGSELSSQEQRVIILQLFGHSYKEMADMLGISVDGVKHHLKMIHRKTGARSYTELFAKYFTPRLNLRTSEDDLAMIDGEPIDGEPEGLAATIEPPMQEGVIDISYSSEKTLGERARRFGDVSFGSVEEFARALKIAPSNLQKYLNGERNPGLAMLQRLHELGCNINSLISGEGSIFADNAAGRMLRAAAGRMMERAGGEGPGILRQREESVGPSIAQ